VLVQVLAQVSVLGLEQGLVQMLVQVLAPWLVLGLGLQRALEWEQKSGDLLEVVLVGDYEWEVVLVLMLVLE
jgi:hypothetical protein